MHLTHKAIPGKAIPGKAIPGKAIPGKASLALALLTVGGLTAVPAHASGPNLVTNPGFETGDLTGYTSSGTVDVTPVSNTGNYAAALPPSSDMFGATGTLSQDISTITGHTYDVSFFLNGFQPNFYFGEVKASFAGFQGADVVNGAFAYTQYSFTATATGSTSTLQFEGTTFGFTGLGTGTLGLDDISVKDTSPVPEASSVVSMALLLALGLGGVAVSRRRKSQSAK